MGEATHGSNEFNGMRLAMFKYLVKNCGYKLFFIESNFVTYLPISHYVETGEGNPQELLYNLSDWLWSGQDALAIIQWMRSYNEHAPANEKLRLLGVDMRNTRALLITIRNYFKNHKTPRQQVVLDKIHGLMQLSFKSAGYLAGAKELGELLSKEVPETSVKGLTDSTWIISFSRKLLLQQVALTETSPESAQIKLRDKFMAENILWFSNMNSRYPNGIFAAHNIHVDKTENFTGGHLKSKLGDKYYAMYLDFAQGYTLAKNMELREQSLSKCFISGNKNAFAYKFSSEHKPAFYLDIRTLPKKQFDLLDQDFVFNNIGSVYRGDANAVGSFNLAKQFDGYIYIPKVTARERDKMIF